MKYLVTEEIESPNKVSKYIMVADFFFVLIYMGIAFSLMSQVHDRLHIPYLIFSLAFSIFLTCKSMFNRKRRNYESLFLMFRHDLNIYRAVYDYDREETEEETENETEE